MLLPQPRSIQQISVMLTVMQCFRYLFGWVLSSLVDFLPCQRTVGDGHRQWQCGIHVISTILQRQRWIFFKTTCRFESHLNRSAWQQNLLIPKTVRKRKLWNSNGVKARAGREKRKSWMSLSVHHPSSFGALRFLWLCFDFWTIHQNRKRKQVLWSHKLEPPTHKILFDLSTMMRVIPSMVKWILHLPSWHEHFDLSICRRPVDHEVFSGKNMPVWPRVVHRDIRS